MRKLSLKHNAIHEFSVWMRTGSNPVDTNWFRSHTGKYVMISKGIEVYTRWPIEDVLHHDILFRCISAPNLDNNVQNFRSKNPSDNQPSLNCKYGKSKRLHVCLVRKISIMTELVVLPNTEAFPTVQRSEVLPRESTLETTSIWSNLVLKW